MFSEGKMTRTENVSLRRFKGIFTPAYTILAAEHPEELAGISDFAGYQIIDGKTTVYICENFTCRRPTTDIDEAMNVLQISSRA